MTPLNATVIMTIGIPHRQVVDVKWNLTPELVLSMAELRKGDRLIFEHNAREMWDVGFLDQRGEHSCRPDRDFDHPVALKGGG